MKILIATNNQNKFDEINAILTIPTLNLVRLNKNQQSPPQETGFTFAENARIKASYYRAQTGCATLADDSGLQVDAIGGAPGVYSSRWETTDDKRMTKILDQLKNYNRPDQMVKRSARFVCTVCIEWEYGIILETASVEGQISLQPAGSSGFGYDPIFYYPPLQKTFGEMTPAKKNEVSHRTRALARIRDRLFKLSELRYSIEFK